jgi:twitching motility protein PilJ
MATAPDLLLTDEQTREVQSLPDKDARTAATRPAARAAKARPGGGTGMLGNLPLLIGALLVSVVGLALFLTLQVQQSTAQTATVGTASRLLLLSQDAQEKSGAAVSGDVEAFKQLAATRDQANAIFKTLDLGDSASGIPATPEDLRPGFQAAWDVWKKTDENIGVILAQQDTLVRSRRNAQRVNEIAPLLLAQTDETVEAMIRETKDTRLVSTASRQRMASQRIAKEVNTFLLGGQAAVAAAAQFGRDVKLFDNTQEQLRGVAGPITQACLVAVDGTFTEVKTSVDEILLGAANYFLAHEASRNVAQLNSPLLEAIRALVDSYAQRRSAAYQWLPWLFGALAALFMFLLARAIVVDARRRAEESARQNRQTQDAILKLLDEMGDLADGDLTVHAEVTDQVTGSIADSINFAVQEMRSLVKRINDAAQQMTGAAGGARATAQQLSQSNDEQARAVTAAAETVTSIARSMEKMAEDARRSADVAQHSVDVAKQGAEAVRTTVRGMDEMRSQIQDTAKRIKRLGESSQQIGEIVGLIEDIAEQTNILSLNAAIQAAMAGEAGRGFAVVAEEVQRLADRSTQATKQIAELIKTIQADTNEAVSSMEGATRGVVTGTQLADAAGQALTEIESVSARISQLIASIAEQSDAQSRSAVKIAGGMESVRGVATTTAQRARDSAVNIGKLTELARELQGSVAGFRLPA